MFNDRKAAQLAAFFIAQGGGTMSVLKLIKLVYLSDREFLARHSVPITYDRLVSMPHGPVNSETLNCLNGCRENSTAWEEWIADRANHIVALRRDFVITDLDELSSAETDVLWTIWKQFGPLTGWQLREYTHQNCPEWRDPDGSSLPIPYKDVLRALGRDEAEATELAEHIESERQIDKIFASL